jgi:tetratricopeptide (TPR) repeat protein
VKRRAFIAGLGSAAAWPVVVRAQHAATVLRAPRTCATSEPRVLSEITSLEAAADACYRLPRPLDFFEGVSAVDHAIELDPMDADAHVGRGRAFYLKKDYAAALTDYDAALRLFPGAEAQLRWTYSAF